MDPSSSPETGGSLRLKNSRCLFTSSNMGSAPATDFSGVPNIMTAPRTGGLPNPAEEPASMKTVKTRTTTIRKKYKVVQAKLKSPPEELELRPWIQELLWKFVSAEITALELNKEMEVRRIGNTIYPAQCLDEVVRFSMCSQILLYPLISIA